MDALVLLVTGAYGRQASIADWEAGLDFQGHPTPEQPWIGGRYISKRDVELLKRLGYGVLHFHNRDRMWREEL